MSYSRKSNYSHHRSYGILTIDIGTSGCRAILFGSDGTIISKAEKLYSFNYDNRTVCAEQNPDEIYKSFIQVTKKCLSKEGDSLRYIILGSVLHSLVLLDEKGKPLAPLSTWADMRSKSQCQRLRKLYYRKGWYQKTGCPLSPSYPLSQLLWYKENDYKLYANFAKAVSIKSYILSRLFGRYLEDYSVASGTGMFNIFTCDWEEEILNYLELDRSRLPDLVPVEYQFSGLSDSMINKLGLPGDVAWIAGSADGPLAHLGSAAYNVGVASLTIGTSGAVRMLSNKPQLSQNSSLWCYILDSKSYVFGIATNNGGNVVDWYVRTFLPKGISWEEIGENIELTIFDPELFFIPFLFDERYLDGKFNVSAAFNGIKYKHSAYDLLRAIVEGVVFNMLSLMEKLKSFQTVKRVVTSGSITRLPFVYKLLSTLIEVPVDRGSTLNASLIGALRIVMGEESNVKNKARLEGNVTKKSVAFKNSSYAEKYFKWKQLCDCKSA